MDMTAIIEAVKELKTDRDKFMTNASPEAARAHLEAALEKFDARFDGVLAPNTLKAMRSEHEAAVNRNYDEARRVEGRALRSKHAEVLKGITGVLDVMRRPARENNPQVDAMRQLAALQMYQGRKYADVLRAYQATSDADNATFVKLIEEELDGFRLTDDPDDLMAKSRLTAAIKARSHARIPKEIHDAYAEAEGALSSVNVSTKLDHLEQGRGIATMLSQPVLRAV